MKFVKLKGFHRMFRIDPAAGIFLVFVCLQKSLCCPLEYHKSFAADISYNIIDMESLLKFHEGKNQCQLEQLERLRSEDTPRRPVITLTIDQFILNPKSILLISSYRIPSQKKVKAEKIRKICEKI